MDAAKVLSEAWSAVEEAALPESLHETAFKLAVGLLTGSASAAPATRVPQPSQPQTRDDNGESRLEPVTAGQGEQRRTNAQLFAKMAEETGIDGDQIGEVLYFDEGGVPHLNGPARKLGGRKADQMRTACVVLCGAYAYARDEADVPAKVVRTEFERLKIMDAKNFATVLGGTKSISAVGSSRSRLYRLKSGDVGLEALQAAIGGIRGEKSGD